MRARRTTLLGAALTAMVLLVTGLAAPASAATTADVNGLSTHVASAHGWTIIHIYGNHLQTAEKVRFGPYVAGHLVVHSDHDLTVLVPVTDRDLTTHIAVYTARAGRSSWSDPQAVFTFIRPPTVSAVTPNYGLASGGQRSTVTGVDLVGVRAVLVGGVRATALNVVNSRRVDFTAPPHAAGVFVVQVITWYGRSTQAIHYRFVPAPEVVGVQPTDGPAAGGGQLVIYGFGVQAADAVTIGGARATIVGPRKDAQVMVIVPAHAPGTVPVSVSVPSGTSAPSLAARYTYTGPNTQTWTAVATVDPSQGSMKSVSCPTGSFCAAIDPHDLYVSTAGSWGAPTRVSGTALAAVSCSSASFCLAVGSPAGQVWNGRSWSTTTQPTGLTHASCPADGECWATDGGQLYRYDGGWSAVVGPDAAGVSCPSATFCMTMSALGDSPVWTWDGARWTRRADDPDGTGSELSCASPTLCATVDIYGRLQTWNGTTWTTSSTAEGGPVSCRAGTCTTAGFRFANGVWSRLVPLPEGFATSALDCPTANACVAVDGFGHATDFDTTGWTRPSRVFATEAPLSSISCPTTTWCAASDEDGDVLFYDGTRWSSPQPVIDAENFPSSISCSSPTFCALAAKDRLATFDGAAWRTVLEPQDVGLQVSCAGSTCFTAGYRYDGHSWIDSGLPIFTDGLSCVTASYCVAVGGGDTAVWNGRTWTQFASSAAGGRVSCWAVGQCVSWDESASPAGAVARLSGTTWTVSAALYPAGDVSCSSANFCGFLSSGAVRTFDGAIFSDQSALGAQPALWGGQISCPVDGTCFAVGTTTIYRGVRHA